MQPLRWERRPGGLRAPALVCAFKGWNDAGESATSALSFMAAGLDATRFATIDPVTGARGTAATPGGLAAAAVRDGDTIYWLALQSSASGLDVPIPGDGSCSVAGAGCMLVASPVPAYDAQPSHHEEPPARIDVVRSGLGYRWVRGPGGTQFLRPPATVPCAISTQPAYVITAARWSTGHHSVSVLRRDAHKAPRPIRTPQTRSYPKLVDAATTRLLRCGDRTRLTYVVTTAGRSQRVSFAVARAAARAR